MHKHLPFIIGLLLLPALALAQGSESRTGVKLDYQPLKKWEFSIEEQLRLKSEGNLFEQLLTEFQAHFEIFEDVKLGLGYRYSTPYDAVGDVQGWEHFQRFHFRVQYKRKLNRWKIGSRIQYQTKRELDIGNHAGNLSDPKNMARFKLKLDYNFRNWKLDPEIFAEWFQEVGGVEMERTRKVRSSIGTTYKMKGPHEIHFRYMQENEIACGCYEPFHILGVYYTFSIK